jgi:hypothetical protein
LLTLSNVWLTLLALAIIFGLLALWEIIGGSDDH